MYDDDTIRAAFNAAYTEARKSPDPSTQVGALLRVGNTDVLAHNHIAHGFVHDEMNLYGEKSILIEHAERSAIFQAARAGVSSTGATLFAPWASCVECARAITTAGVTTLVRHEEAMMRTPERWQPSIDIADQVLRSGGVEIIEWSGTVGAQPIRFNGMAWKP